LHWLLKAAITSIKIIAILNSIDIVAAVLISELFNYSILDIFALILLLEAAILMLSGSAFELSSSAFLQKSIIRIRTEKNDPHFQKKITSNVVLYSMAGGILFVEMIILAITR